MANDRTIASPPRTPGAEERLLAPNGIIANDRRTGGQP
jgi:hypothetical protein